MDRAFEKIKSTSTNLLSIGAAGFAVVVSIGILVLLQGGFYSLPVCVIGVLLSVASLVLAIKNRRELGRIPLTTFALIALALLFVLSAVIKSPTLTSFSEAGTWFAVAAISLLAWNQCERQKEKSINAIAWLGIASTALAFLIQCDVVRLSGTYVSERLYFTFQYANSAAAWFAVVTILSFFSSNALLRRFTPLTIASLLFTMSGGAILVFLLSSICCITYLMKRRRALIAAQYVTRCAVGFLLFAAVQATPEPVNIVWFAVGISACLFSDKPNGVLLKTTKSRAILLGVAAIAVIAAVVFTVQYWYRITEAVLNFSIRIAYDIDGLSLLMTSPIIGIGPDMWQYEYPHIQTAQYHSTVLHCSYLQIALDAGLLGLLAFIAAVVLGMRELVGTVRRSDGKSYLFGSVIATSIICVHSLVDFDLQFAALAFLLAFLITQPGRNETHCGSEEEESISVRSEKRKTTANLIAGIIAALICMLMCFVGYSTSQTQRNLKSSASLADFSSVCAQYVGNILCLNDPGAQELFLQAAYLAGRYDEIAGFCNVVGVSTDKQALYGYEALYFLGMFDEAADVLLGELEKQPLNDEFYIVAKQQFDAVGVTDECIKRYNSLVDKANQAALNKSPFMLDEPAYIEPYERAQQ